MKTVLIVICVNCIDRYMCEVFFHRWCPVRVHPDVGLILRFLFVILGYCKASPFDCSYTYLVSQRERESSFAFTAACNCCRCL